VLKGFRGFQTGLLRPLHSPGIRMERRQDSFSGDVSEDKVVVSEDLGPTCLAPIQDFRGYESL